MLEFLAKETLPGIEAFELVRNTCADALSRYLVDLRSSLSYPRTGK